MKASKFTDAKKAFIIKQAEDGTPIGHKVPAEPMKSAHDTSPCI